MKIRYILAILFLMAGHFLYGQTPVVEETSATNGEVKIHSGKRLKKFRGNTHSTERQGQAIGKPLKTGQVQATERQGQAIGKPSRTGHAQGTERPGRSIRKGKSARSRAPGNEAKVFKRHKNEKKVRRPKRTADVRD
jgi:hypothetical protein